MAELEDELALVRAALEAFHTRRRLDLELARVRGLALAVVPDKGLSDEDRVARALARARERLVEAVAP